MHFDAPSHIFIARNEQVRKFRSCLDNWYESITIHQDIALSNEQSVISSPIRGPVVLVYGRGGMGKSTLLSYYRDEAISRYHDVTVSRVINWENITATTPFQDLPRVGGALNMRGFFATLAEQLASTLAIDVGALKAHEQASRSLRNFHRQLERVPSFYAAERQNERLLNTSDQDDAGSRSIDQLTYYIDAFLYKDGRMPLLWRQEIEYILSSTSLQGEHIVLLWEPERLLGEALGRDLSMYAAERPLLLFFDSYESTVEEDNYLRIVMRAAGERVGWVIASRDDLWSGHEYIRRSGVAGQGYQEVVLPGRGLPIDLDSPSGFFSVPAIQLYFDKLRAQQPSLPAMHPDMIERIASITQGIPLGVHIITELCMKEPEVLFHLSPANELTEVIDQLMLHYLAYPEQKEKKQLCGLALLRHMKNEDALLTTLGLPLDQQDRYEDVIIQLRRNAGFVFNEHGAPYLHKVVRNIIRQWLLRHRHEPDKHQLFLKLKHIYAKAQQAAERAINGGAIHSLFVSPRWVEASLDLIEILFWIDVEDGMHRAMPFLIASSVYNHAVMQELIQMVAFFESQISEQLLAYWRDAMLVLSPIHNHRFTNRQKVQKLTSIIDDFGDFVPQAEDADTLLSDYHDEIIALLCWKVGDVSLYDDESKALEWYLQAWEALKGDQMLQRTIMQLYLQRAYHFFDNGQYEQSEYVLEQALNIECNRADIYYTLGNIYYVRRQYERAITLYQYAIVSELDHVHAYMNLGNAHYMLKDYQRAIAEYDKTQERAHGHPPPSLYYNRANAYDACHLFKQAEADYTQAITLFEQVEADYDQVIAHQLAWAYGNRGRVRAALRRYRLARRDFKHATKLAPNDINVVWTATWAAFTVQRLQAEDSKTLLHIAELDPHHYAAFICKAIVAGVRDDDWQAALIAVEQAVMRAPDEGDPHFWKGLIAAYLEEMLVAKEEIEKAVDLGLPPLFLTPLRWLQNDKPELFTTYIEPLLQQYQC